MHRTVSFRGFEHIRDFLPFAFIYPITQRSRPSLALIVQRPDSHFITTRVPVHPRGQLKHDCTRCMLRSSACALTTLLAFSYIPRDAGSIVSSFHIPSSSIPSIYTLCQSATHFKGITKRHTHQNTRRCSRFKR